MSANPHALLFSACNIDAEREDDFNDWYDNVHCPELLAVPGVRTAVRYRHSPIESFPQDRPIQRYLALYEIDDLNVFDTEAFKAVRGWGTSGLRPSVTGLDLRTYKSL